VSDLGTGNPVVRRGDLEYGAGVDGVREVLEPHTLRLPTHVRHVARPVHHPYVSTHKLKY